MKLPPVPYDAVYAVLREAGVSSTDEGECDWARGDLEVAWPYLYAAALRDAASRLSAEGLMDDYGISHSAGGGNFVAAAVHQLRDFADEATP